MTSTSSYVIKNWNSNFFMNTYQAVEVHDCKKLNLCSDKQILLGNTSSSMKESECRCEETIGQLNAQINNLTIQMNMLQTLINDIRENLYIPAFDEKDIYLQS